MPTTLEQYAALADRLDADDRTPVRAAAAIRHLIRALEAACEDSTAWGMHAAETTPGDYLTATAEPEKAADDRAS